MAMSKFSEYMTFETKYKNLIDFLKETIPEDAGKNKPLLPHLLRVGTFLHDHGYSEEVVKAGLLHDMIEWTDHPQHLICDSYGEHVYEIVLANTKNRDITNPQQRREDYVNRCANVGLDALIVKAADILDSYAYYSEHGNTTELDRSVQIAKLILAKVDKSLDPIFEKLDDLAHN